MIKDKIINYKKYYNLSTNMQVALQWLSEQDLSELQCGKYIIKEKEIFANIQEYETKKDALYEAHRKYIDIQCIINGCEYVGIQKLQNCFEAIPYNESDDIIFLNTNTPDNYIELKKDEMLILYPEDAHKPSINQNTTFVKKLVIKVAVN